MTPYSFFNRDLSWLSFNERILMEAEKDNVPLLERIKFLSIYSSNLDEFYRVRMPSLLALKKILKDSGEEQVYEEAKATIDRQQAYYGSLLKEKIIPALAANNIQFIYKQPIPGSLLQTVNDYFYNNIAAYLQPVLISNPELFFPENNKLYLAVVVERKESGQEQLYFVNIPSDRISRFFAVELDGVSYILFLDDMIRQHLTGLFPGAEIKGAYSVKITRDAELDLLDEYEGDLAEKMEKQLSKRDFGFATRVLHAPGMPLRHLESFITGFNLSHASIVEGGTYHNLKDLADFPVKAKSLTYPKWPAINSVHIPAGDTLFRHILQKDIVVHAPYQNYETVLRFFNEAVIDESVEEIFVTLYRVANDSRIVSALISAARNGKKVSVMVELKARFDEGNNIKWAKRMKDAGIKIIYSDNALKVHAKIALVKRKIDGNTHYSGLLSTGNLNESTARFYTDHILLTTHQEMLMEIELLFQFLSKKKKSQEDTSVPFHHLLVAQFNLQSRFIALIDREIEHARAGRPAAITIKLNNLEEEVMISKLYEASNAGVKIELIVRSICRLKPGIEGQSEHIRIRRIVDTYLEHGRVYLFHNNGHEELYMGSADWMNRNIYRRIEVCFPVYDPAIKEEIKKILALQLQDNRQAVWLNRELKNIPVNTPAAEKPLRSQEAIYRMLQQSNVPQEYEPVEP